MSDANAAGERIGDLLGSLSEETAALVRRELEAAREQAAGQLRRSVAGIGMLGAAGVFGGLALGTGTTALIRTLDRLLPRRWGAGLTTLLYAGLAGGLAAAGAQELRRHATEIPEAVTEAVSDDLTVAVEGAQHTAGR